MLVTVFESCEVDFVVCFLLIFKEDDGKCCVDISVVDSTAFLNQFEINYVSILFIMKKKRDELNTNRFSSFSIFDASDGTSGCTD